MNTAAQVVKPKVAPAPPEPVRTASTVAAGSTNASPSAARTGLNCTPRYLSAGISLGGTHDPAEREAERAAGVVAAGGHYRVADPGGRDHLRASPILDPGAAGRIKRTMATPVVPPMIAPPVIDPGGRDSLRRAIHADGDGAASGTAPLRMLSNAAEPRHGDAEAANRIEDARKTTGHSLPGTVRERLEHGFGESLEDVRVHTSPVAHAAADAVQARAYTEGERITLGRGESEHDLALMAHEVTHVLQSRRAHPDGNPGAASASKIRREARPAAASDSDDGRKYRMRDGRTIELPPDMTAAEAAKLEADGAAAKVRLGKTPPPSPVPDVHKPADKTGAKKPPPKPPARSVLGHAGSHASGPRSAGATAQLTLAGGKVGQYLISKARPILTRGIAKLAVLSRHQQTHADAGHKVQQAEKSVVIPVSEGQSKSNFGQVGAVAGRPPPDTDENKGKRQLQESLAQNVPKSIEDVDNFKRDQKAEHTGADVLKVVQTDKNAVVVTFADMEHTPQPLPPEHAAEPLPPQEVAPPTPAMDLGRDAVAPLLPEHTDVSKYTKDADARLQQEGVTQEQLDMVDSGDLAAANKEKKGMESAARTEPLAVQKFAQDATQRLDSELQQEEKTERGALAAKHRHGLGLTAQQQKGAKSTLEKKRDEVAAKINGIYTSAQGHVKQRLADLDTVSMKRFDDGNAIATKAFEDDVNRELDAYKDDRYSGVFGWARKAKDWLLGMDDLPAVKSIFERNRASFVRAIDKLVADISADNKRVVQECKDELTQARTDIQTYVDKLGPELKDIATKTAGEVNGKLDELDGFIRKKEEELQHKLADKQQAAIKAIDEKIEKMKEAMAGALHKLGQLLLWAAKKFFTWALGQFGYSLSEIEGIISKGAAVLKAIFTKPIQFVKNLIAAAKLGFQNFGKNFLTHLKDAIFDWLTGSLEGLTLPSSWDLKGIASVALQMLGLTWTNIRGKLVKVLGEPVVKTLEAGFDLVVTLVRDGPMAAWEKLQDMAGAIKQAFIEAVQDFIKIKIIQQAITTIVSLFIPGAGIVRAIIGIYDTVVFFIQKAKQIMEMIGSFLGSIGDIAAGNISGAADALEKGLATGLTLVINFLAKFLRLDGITAKIRGAIQKLRDKVDAMLDRVVDWIAGKAKALFAKAFGKDKGGDKMNTALEADTNFAIGQEKHEIKLSVEQGQSKLTMSSGLLEGFHEHIERIKKEWVPLRVNNPAGDLAAELDRLSADGQALVISANRLSAASAQSMALNRSVDGLATRLKAICAKFHIPKIEGLGSYRQPPPHAPAYRKVDGYGRATDMLATLSFNTRSFMRSTNPSVSVPGTAIANYQRGHLLAASLGGSNSDPANFAPMSVATNTSRGGIANFERALREALGQDVFPPWIVTYGIRPSHPSDIASLQASLDELMGPQPGAAAALYAMAQKNLPFNVGALVGVFPAAKPGQVSQNQELIRHLVLMNFVPRRFGVTVNIDQAPEDGKLPAAQAFDNHL